MQKSKIEWCTHTWNPVVGCKHGCNYCYAKRMNDRFKWIKKWDEPQWIEDRIMEPYELKKPSKIFVCSIADLFGDWVPDKWIRDVIKTAEQNQRHTFQFLTKNPKRYSEFKFPKNCWLGVTLTNSKVQSVWKLNELKKKKNYKFVSFEPLLDYMSLLDLSEIDLVIVGAMTGPGTIEPKKEWIDSIKHKNIFYKSNIKKYL